MDEVFRIRQTSRMQAVVLIAFFAFAGAGWLGWFFLQVSYQRKWPGHVVDLAVPGAFSFALLLAALLCVVTYVERVTIRGTVICIRGVSRDREFDVSQIESFKWSRCPEGGSFRLRGGGTKARVALAGYSREDRLRMIRALRKLVPELVQEGWPYFCQTVALPLRDGRRDLLRVYGPEKLILVTRRRYDRTLLVCLPISIILAMIVYLWLDLAQWFVLPVFLVMLWLPLRVSVPRNGYSDLRLTPTPAGRAALAGASGVVAAKLIVFALVVAGIDSETACTAALPVLAIGMLLMFHWMFKASRSVRKARRHDEQSLDAACSAWEIGEG